jgi:hypothetical protein
MFRAPSYRLVSAWAWLLESNRRLSEEAENGTLVAGAGRAQLLRVKGADPPRERYVGERNDAR